MREAGASILEVDLGPQEKILLKRRQTDGRLIGKSVLEKSTLSSGSVKITAPLSGIFYRASSPSASPYVAIGQRVAVGDILCIIEAMKVMNEIKAVVGGRLIEILGVNGKHVKKGDVLFVIDKEGS